MKIHIVDPNNPEGVCQPHAPSLLFQQGGTTGEMLAGNAHHLLCDLGRNMQILACLLSKTPEGQQAFDNMRKAGCSLRQVAVLIKDMAPPTPPQGGLN